MEDTLRLILILSLIASETLLSSGKYIFFFSYIPLQSLTTCFFVRYCLVIDAFFYFIVYHLLTWYLITLIIFSCENQKYVKFRHFESWYYLISVCDIITRIWMEILWDFLLLITFLTTLSILVSTSYVGSCTYLVSPNDAALVTLVNYYSVSPSSSGWFNWYYVFYEAISVPDI